MTLRNPISTPVRTMKISRLLILHCDIVVESQKQQDGFVTVKSDLICERVRLLGIASLYRPKSEADSVSKRFSLPAIGIFRVRFKSGIRILLVNFVGSNSAM